MAKQSVNIGSVANDGTGDTLRAAYDKLNDNDTEIYSLLGNGTTLSITGDVSVSSGAVTIANDAVEQAMIADDAVGADQLASSAVVTASIVDDNVTHAKWENRYKEIVSITTLTGTVAFNCELGSSFKLSGDLTGAYTINLSNYKKGQMITIFPLKGNQTLNLSGQGSSTNTFNKIGGVDYNDDGSSSNILQIECVDDSATDPIFFYSLGTFVSDSSDI